MQSFCLTIRFQLIWQNSLTIILLKCNFTMPLSILYFCSFLSHTYIRGLYCCFPPVCGCSLSRIIMYYFIIPSDCRLSSKCAFSSFVFIAHLPEIVKRKKPLWFRKLNFHQDKNKCTTVLPFSEKIIVIERNIS